MLNDTNQTQKAVDNAIQIQAGTVILGIDEKRAREVYKELFEQELPKFAVIAYRVANERVAKLENALIPKINSIEGALNNFADPAFQLLLRQAQKTAIATEREADYELLSELLVHRVKNGKNKKIMTGTFN